MPIDDKVLLESQLIGRQIRQIRIFHVNDHYFSISETSVIIDGGISLDFDDFQLNIGWSEEKELFDTTTDPIQTLFGDISTFNLIQEEADILTELRDKKVISSNIRWNYYRDIDWQFQPISGERHAIEEIILRFEGGAELQIATIDYNLVADEIAWMHYKLEGELLVTLNQIIDIDNSD